MKLTMFDFSNLGRILLVIAGIVLVLIFAGRSTGRMGFCLRLNVPF
jgi:hypothetical protein